MTEPAAFRRARGAYYTPTELADFIARWAIRTRGDVVMEPSVGEGVFLRAAAAVLRETGGTPDRSTLHGFEMHKPSIANAVASLRTQGADASVSHGDFFTHDAVPMYSAVIGNPPFLRFHHFSGKQRSSARRRSLEAGVRLGGRSNAWAYFVVHAAQFVAPGGRLGLVLPAELLTSDFAVAVRKFLLRRFGDVRILAFRQRVFSEVDTEILVMLAEGTGPATHFKVFEADDLSELGKVEELGWSKSILKPSQKWTSALLEDEHVDLFSALSMGGDFDRMDASWGKASIGAVTGATNYFRLTPSDAHQRGLGDADLQPLYPGWRYVKDLTFTRAMLDRLEDHDVPVLLFYPEADDPRGAAGRYIEAGETDGVDTSSGKCSERDPWWRVPLPPVAELFLANTSHRTPVLVANRARARHTNTYYGIELKPNVRRAGKDLLPLGALNTVSLLGAELVGRSHGNGGLKLSVSEVDAWPVPTPELLETSARDLRELRRPIRGLVEDGRLLDAAELVDEIVLKESGVSEAQLSSIRNALLVLQERRAARGAQKARSGRASG